MRHKNLHIEPIPALKDNYIWLLHNARDAVVIDPGEAAPVLAALKEKSLQLKAILVTHHHADHINGISALLSAYSPAVYAPKYNQFDFPHTPLGEGDHVTLAALGLQFQVMWLPGHTLDHIAYIDEPHLFCGDVLFSAGCGRLFEGSPQQMLTALNRLKALPPTTQIYCTHEYTSTNIDFALTLDPDNQALLERKRVVAALRSAQKPSLPSTIGLELQINPFLRCDEAPIIEHADTEKTDTLSVFSKIRTLRNHY